MVISQTMKRLCNIALLVCLPWFSAFAQTAADNSADIQQRWNLSYQATTIGQQHGTFTAPYTGPLSLLNESEHDVSLTATIFFGLRLWRNTQLYFDPEIAGGRGFSGINGVANATNGELPRVATATPKPYLARLYISQDFGFGSEKESVMSADNRLGGSRPAKRYTVIIGRFTLTDFFDNNQYSHDPRSQFMGWAVMYNGAWDYPADTRGYTWGWVHEFHTKRWSVRYASAGVSKVANGERIDHRILADHGDVFEGEIHYSPWGRAGALRVLGYQNHFDGGSYGAALQLAAATGTTPNVAAIHRSGTLKYGFGVNAEQEIFKGVGVFGRLGWSDGKTESFEFTAVDRLATAGVSVSGKRWRRPEDTVGSEITVSGLSAVHALYLERGGLDFLIGDGRLNYGTENIWESFYDAKVFKGFFVSVDAQHIQNPAYNRDRGPLWAYSLRLHVEGKIH